MSPTHASSGFSEDSSAIDDGSGVLVDRERSPHDGLGDQAAADLLDRDVSADDLAVFQHPDRLQVQPEFTERDAGGLATVAAQILGLTTLTEAATEGGGVIAVQGRPAWRA